MEKRRTCSLGAISPIFHNIFLPVVRFSCLGRDQIPLRDKRLFEISEAEITRVNCIYDNVISRIDKAGVVFGNHEGACQIVRIPLGIDQLNVYKQGSGTAE